MNAGAHGREMQDVVIWAKYIDFEGNIKTLENKDLQFGYRKSIFSESDIGIIIEAKLKFEFGDISQISEKMQQYSTYRKEKQPITYPSAGSTFKRGEDFITAKLIDECGLKGYKIGDAQVSTIHAGFVVNIGNATAEEVIEVVNYVKQTVFEKTGKQIELEMELLGEF